MSKINRANALGWNTWRLLGYTVQQAVAKLAWWCRQRNDNAVSTEAV